MFQCKNEVSSFWTLTSLRPCLIMLIMFAFSCLMCYLTPVSCVVFYCRGIILFRPSRLNNKFEEGSVKFSEDTFTNAKIKQFIQDNM